MKLTLSYRSITMLLNAMTDLSANRMPGGQAAGIARRKRILTDLRTQFERERRDLNQNEDLTDEQKREAVEALFNESVHEFELEKIPVGLLENNDILATGDTHDILNAFELVDNGPQDEDGKGGESE